MRSHFIIYLLLAVPAKAQFTTVQTQVESNCRDVEGIEEGDVPSICDGYGDYQLYRYYNFYGSPIYRIEKADFEATMMPLASSDNYQFGSAVHWRLDKGVPFAAIMQVTLLSNNEETNVQETIGDYYIVRGLGAFPELSMDVPAGETTLEKILLQCDRQYIEYLKE